jgi:peptidoglycan/LPS O-acetylase OafA/YrhL
MATVQSRSSATVDSWLRTSRHSAIGSAARKHHWTSHPTRVLAWGIPAFLIVLSFLSLNPNRTPLQRLMVLLGDASYAIYLTHPLVMITYARLLKGGLANVPQWPIIPIVVLLSASLGLLVHVFVERRLLASARGLFNRRLASGHFPQEQPRHVLKSRISTRK